MTNAWRKPEEWAILLYNLSCEKYIENKNLSYSGLLRLYLFLILINNTEKMLLFFPYYLILHHSCSAIWNGLLLYLVLGGIAIVSCLYLVGFYAWGNDVSLMFREWMSITVELNNSIWLFQQYIYKYIFLIMLNHKIFCFTKHFLTRLKKGIHFFNAYKCSIIDSEFRNTKLWNKNMRDANSKQTVQTRLLAYLY